MNPLEMFNHNFVLFLLVLIRISGLLFVAPIIGGPNVPTQVKVILALFLTFIIFPFLPAVVIPPITSNIVLFLAILSELLVGLLIGLAASLIFTAIQLAGHIVDQEMGIGLANVLDPITNTNITILGQFKYFIAMLLFIAIDGHLYLIKAITHSFTIVPIFNFTMTERLALYFSDTLVTQLFILAVKIAAPMAVALLVTTIAMGFIARTVPEMNIFIMGFALRIGVGFGILLIVIPIICSFFVDELNKMLYSLNGIMRMMTA